MGYLLIGHLLQAAELNLHLQLQWEGAGHRSRGYHYNVSFEEDEFLVYESI